MLARQYPVAYLALAFGSLLLSTWVAPAEACDAPDYQRGVDAVSSGDYERAIVYLTRVRLTHTLHKNISVHNG